MCECIPEKNKCIHPTAQKLIFIIVVCCANLLYPKIEFRNSFSIVIMNNVLTYTVRMYVFMQIEHKKQRYTCGCHRRSIFSSISFQLRVSRTNASVLVHGL